MTIGQDFVSIILFDQDAKPQKQGRAKRGCSGPRSVFAISLALVVTLGGCERHTDALPKDGASRGHQRSAKTQELWRQVRQLAEQGSRDGISESLWRIVETDPQDVTAWCILAQRVRDEAVEEDDARVRYWRTRTAIQTLLDGADANPKSAKLLFTLGTRLFSWIGRCDESSVWRPHAVAGRARSLWTTNRTKYGWP